MGTRKTDLDIRREEKARAINAALHGTRVEVVAGGKHGPYSVIVSRLSEPEMRSMLRMLAGRGGAVAKAVATAERLAVGETGEG